MQEVLNICDDDRDHGGERSKVHNFISSSEILYRSSIYEYMNLIICSV